MHPSIRHLPIKMCSLNYCRASHYLRSCRLLIEIFSNGQIISVSTEIRRQYVDTQPQRIKADFRNVYAEKQMELYTRYFIFPQNVNRIIEILKRRFGRPKYIIFSLLDKLKKRLLSEMTNLPR